MTLYALSPLSLGHYDTVRPLTTVTGTLPVLSAEFNAFLIVTECWNLNKELIQPVLLACFPSRRQKIGA